MIIRVRDDLMINTDHIVSIDLDEKEIFLDRSIPAGPYGKLTDTIQVQQEGEKGNWWQHFSSRVSCFNTGQMK